MQELVLIQPIRAAEEQWTREAAHAARRRDFEERLAECGPLAYRVARCVLRNDADAEDVAQEALLRAYRRFDRLRDPQWAQPVRRPASRTAEELAASSEFQAHFDRALDALPEKLRLVLLLSAMDGYTVEEVAAMLGLPVGTVKSRLFAGRKKLAEKLQCYVTNTKKR